MLVNLMDVLSADKPHLSKEKEKKINKYQVLLWDLEKNMWKGRPKCIAGIK